MKCSNRSTNTAKPDETGPCGSDERPRPPPLIGTDSHMPCGKATHGHISRHNNLPNRS